MAFDSINQTQPPATPFARDPEYTSNPAQSYQGPTPPSSGAGTSSPITPAVMGNQRPPSVASAPQKTAFDAYSEERMAKDQNYQRELKTARMRGARSGNGALTDEIENKYKQQYRDEWSRLSDDQRAETSNNYVATGVIGKQNAVNTSRLDAADFKGQTSNEKLNGIAAGTGGHYWDADSTNNVAARNKGQMAIQKLIATKEQNGVNPYTNEYVGVAPTKDITNSVAQETGTNNITKSIATPYGTVTASNGNLGDNANKIGQTNAATSGVADMKSQQSNGGTPIADMIAKQADPSFNPANQYAAPVTPTNPTAQETEEQKRKRQQQSSSQPTAPVQAQQATPQAIASNE